MTKQKKSAQDTYISFNREESQALMLLDDRALRLYFACKWKANFSTGKVGSFFRQHITFDVLAKLASVPAAKGRKAIVCTPKDAARSLIRLSHAGLVGEMKQVESDKGAKLHFTLPLSPIKKKIGADSPAPRLSSDAPTKSAESPAPTRVSEVSPPPVSVLRFSERINTSLINTNSSGRSPDDAGAHAGNGAPEKSPAPRGATPSIPEIEERLNADGFCYVETDVSRTIYGRWAKRGYSAAEIEQAVAAVASDFTKRRTPGEVDDAISEARGAGRLRKGTGRGRVAL